MRLSRPTSSLRAAAAAGLALLAAACATAPSPTVTTPAVRTPVAPPPPPPAPMVPVSERLRRAVELLNTGDAAAARTEVNAALAADADNALARSLLRQIDTDPRQLLGERSFPHRIQSGETLSGLAEKYLGDPSLFYALARYNGLAQPGSPEVGRVIQIPGVAPKRTAPRRAENTAPRPAGPAAPPPPAAPARDPARAARLRAQALPLLAKGEAGRAAALLREALRLDPDSAPLQRDLARAERIGARVR